MKKIILLLVTLTIMFSVLSSVGFAESNISIYVNEQPLQCDAAPFIENGRTLVPMRQIFEALNAEVLWEDKTKTITAIKGDVKIVLQINNKAMYKNGTEIVMDVAPVISADRTFVPIRAVSQSLGAEVMWCDGNKTVYIDSPEAYSAVAEKTQYARSYADILSEKIKSDKYAHSTFSLVYIDNNDIPELVIGINDSHAAGAEVYTYVDGQIVQLSRYVESDYNSGVSDVFGEFGGILYREREGLFTSQYWGMGCEFITIYQLENGKLSEVVTLNGAEEYPETTVIYEINGSEVDRDTYMSTRMQYGFTGEYYSPEGYSNSNENKFDLIKENIESALGF